MKFVESDRETCLSLLLLVWLVRWGQLRVTGVESRTGLAVEQCVDRSLWIGVRTRTDMNLKL